MDKYILGVFVGFVVMTINSFINAATDPSILVIIVSWVIGAFILWLGSRASERIGEK